MTQQIDFLSDPVIPMLDAGWVRDNPFDAEARAARAAIRLWHDAKIARDKAEDAVDIAFQNMRRALANVEAKRIQEEQEDAV